MSWVSDYKYKWFEILAMNILRSGGIPRHIGFVMDGNRRYAKSEQIRKIDGHAKGFNKLADCLRWCLDLGIQEVTTFAFSIENFKRSDEEVNGLLDLAREKFTKLIQEENKLQEHGVRIRVIGNISLLPNDLQTLIANAILKTEKNDKLFLNIAFSYTSRDEITHAVESILFYGNEIIVEDVSERLVQECLYTSNSSSFPDLLFRTSGETRVSDFLMWQLNATVLYFTEVLWPKISIWNFMAGIFAYQRTGLRMKSFKMQKRVQYEQIAKTNNFYTERVQEFLQKLNKRRNIILLNLT